MLKTFLRVRVFVGKLFNNHQTINLKTMKIQHFFKTIFVTLCIVTVFSCSDDDDTTFPPTSETIADFVASNSDYSSLLAALERADLVTTLSGSGSFTVFAPDNDAFDAFLNGTALTDVPVEDLRALLLNHVIGGKFTSSQLSTSYVDNEAGLSSYINVTDGDVTINGEATVTTADIDRSNGVIHAVDKVIDIPTMLDFVTANPDLSSLATVATDNSATVISALGDEDGDLTLLAPDNAAFTDLGDISGLSTAEVEQVLLNHAIAEGLQSTELSTGYGSTLAAYGTTTNNLNIHINTIDGVVFNGISRVTTANIVASNGVIHIVDKVITLPTVVTFATADATFSTLVTALTTATPSTDFVATLSTANGTAPAPFTVFAPTNDAFDDLFLELLVEGIADIDEPLLTSVLNYHVVPNANVTSDLLPDFPTAMTLNGTVTIGATPPTVTGADNATASNIIAADVQAANGVIHVIDQVLLPEPPAPMALITQ